jgi:hypothetical protein
MPKYRPVEVPNAAFIFCRYSITILIWLSLIFKSVWLLGLVSLIFILSAILKVRRAPMIMLYKYTINKLFKSDDVILNESAIRFAHIIGAIFSLVCIVVLFLFNTNIGWYFVAGFGILKTISALGFCPASKLYECALNGQCCMRKKSEC